MSVKINVGKTKFSRGDLFAVDPNEVLPGEFRGRFDAPEVDRLRVIERAVSFFTQGQLEPIECRRLADQRLKVTMGFNRRAAAILLRQGFEFDGTIYHRPEFLLQVKIVDCNDKQATDRNIDENLERAELSPMDYAVNQNFYRVQYLMSEADIAKRWKMAGATVAKYRKLLLLDEKHQLLVHTLKLAVDAAVDLLDLPSAERDAALTDATKATGKVNGQVIRGKARSKAAEAGTNNRVRARSIKEIRTDLSAIAEKGDETLKRFVQDVLEYVSGKTTEKALKNAVERLRG